MPTARWRRALLALLLLPAAGWGLLAGPPAALAAPGETSADKVTVVADSPAAGEVRVTVTVAPEWHIYGEGDSFDQGTKVAIVSGADGLVVGAFSPDRPPTPHKVEFVEGERMEYEGTIAWTAKVSLAPGAAAGKRTLKGTVDVFACDASSCLAPGTAEFEVEVEPVVAGAVGEAVEAPTNPGASTSGGDPNPSPEASFFLAAFLGGLLTILTPCVFPMLPLTVSLLTKASMKDGKPASGNVVTGNALSYSAGMFFSLVAVGLVLALVFKVAPTRFALHPVFNLGIFALFIVLALSLLGAFDLQIPGFLREWAQGRAGTRGGAGLFFMGMTLAFTSFSCAAPFVGTLAVQARGDTVRAVAGMSVYAATFTAPFFVMALFPGLLARLPRSGGWLNAVKVVMGFVELAVAFKFLRTADVAWGWGVFTYDAVLAVWSACCIGAAVYLLGFIVLPHDEKEERIGVARLLWALLFLTLAILFAAGVAGRRMPAVVESFVIPAGTGPSGAVETGGGASAGDHDELAWIENDLAKALAKAKAEKKPIFIDFTGVG